jgi:hypothetical protein
VPELVVLVVEIKNGFCSKIGLLKTGQHLCDIFGVLDAPGQADPAMEAS